MSRIKIFRRSVPLYVVLIVLLLIGGVMAAISIPTVQRVILPARETYTLDTSAEYVITQKYGYRGVTLASFNGTLNVSTDSANPSDIPNATQRIVYLATDVTEGHYILVFNFNETSANSISEGVKYRVEVYAERADTGNYELIARFYLTNSPPMTQKWSVAT